MFHVERPYVFCNALIFLEAACLTNENTPRNGRAWLPTNTVVPSTSFYFNLSNLRNFGSDSSDSNIVLFFALTFILFFQVRQGWKTEQKLKQPAWEEFLAVCRVLRRYDALEDVEQDDEEEAEASGEGAGGRIEPKPTAFGRMLGAINAENQLWMALVLTRCGTCPTPDRPGRYPYEIAVS